MSQAPSRASQRKSGDAANQKTADVQPTQETIDKYKDLDDQAIRKIRVELVNDLKLEEVAQLDAYMRTRVVDNTAKVLQQIKDELDKKLNGAFNQLDADLANNDNDFDQEELKTRENYDKIFAETKKRHINEIATLLTEKKLEESRAQVRDVAKSIEYRTKAKHLAMSGEVDEAFIARDQAAQEKKDGIEARMEDLNTKYEKVIGKVQEHQAHELAEINDNLEKALIAIETRRANKKDILEKKFVVDVRSYKVKAIAQGCDRLKNPANRPEFTEKLTLFVEDKVYAAGKQNYFQA